MRNPLHIHRDNLDEIINKAFPQALAIQSERPEDRWLGLPTIWYLQGPNVSITYSVNKPGTESLDAFLGPPYPIETRTETPLIHPLVWIPEESTDSDILLWINEIVAHLSQCT